MGSMRRVQIDGKIVLVPDDPDPGHVNPPLTALNKAARKAEEARREDVTGAVKAASGAMTQALLGRDGRRSQKPLAPHFLPKKAG